MALIDNVRRALLRAFPGAEVRLRRKPANRVGGSLVWEGFDTQMQIDRQVQLRQAIGAALSPDQQPLVSFILTLTPDEEAILAEQ